MSKKILILGKDPLKKRLVQQYEAHGDTVRHLEELTEEGICVNDYDELCLLANIGQDDKAIALLAQLATKYDVEAHDGKRLLCHLLLQSNKALQMLHTCDLCDAVKQKIDVYPFTMDEVWSRGIVLDYEPITVQSEKHVHLVIFGKGEIAEMVALQAALVAHYPNYIRNHSLRTRITMIDPEHGDCIFSSKDGFVRRYQHLFDNSYYRMVKPSEEKAVVLFHHPIYEGRREDFVDVEWEFVEAGIDNVDVREKLMLWANDEMQLLTVVFAHQDEDKNKSESLLLPQELYRMSTPIYIYSKQDKEYDITLPLVRMAKNVNYVYDHCYAENYSPSIMHPNYFTIKNAVEIDFEERERSWSKLSNVKRMSSIYNAMTIPTKMRSIGLMEDEWERFYDISQHDIELLAQVEHNRWNVEELILGFRPCTDEEQKAVEADVKTQKKNYKSRKIHYDLRAYSDLRPDETGKSVKVYDLCLSACLPLIAKTFADEEGGEL